MRLSTAFTTLFSIALLTSCEQHSAAVAAQSTETKPSATPQDDASRISATQQAGDMTSSTPEYGVEGPPTPQRPVPHDSVGNYVNYKSREFGYEIAIPVGYRVITDDRPAEPFKKRAGFLCLSATDSLKGTRKYATDERISHNVISVSFEPVSDYTSRPTPEKLALLSVKQLLGVELSGDPTDVSKRTVTVNGVPMLEVKGTFATPTEKGDDFEKYSTLLWVNGDYLYRAASRSSSRYENTPSVPPGADEHQVGDGLVSINTIKVIPVK